MYDTDNQSYTLLLATMLFLFCFMLTLVGSLVLVYLQRKWIGKEEKANNLKDHGKP